MPVIYEKLLVSEKWRQLLSHIFLNFLLFFIFILFFIILFIYFKTWNSHDEGQEREE